MLEYEQFGRDLLRRGDLDSSERQEIEALVSLMEVANNRRRGLNPNQIINPQSRMLSQREAAEYLKVNPKTVYRYARLGLLAKYGSGRPRYRQAELDNLLLSRQSNP